MRVPNIKITEKESNNGLLHYDKLYFHLGVGDTLIVALGQRPADLYEFEATMVYRS